MYRVRVTELAKQDVRHNLIWWGENRSQEQAERWYFGIYDAFKSLASTADRHSLATEPALKQRGIHQASFGLGRRPTHRVIFGIVDQVVVVYRVRAFKQDVIDVDDLSSDDETHRG